jgi:glycosyltransferase involved in cell wall biosynthesis
MRHLLICREYPPAPYPPGGIGTYVRNIGKLLAEDGETVHIIAQRWEGAPSPITESINGRLIIHRIPLETPLKPRDEWPRRILRALGQSDCPGSAFSWQVAHYAEGLVEAEGIDSIEAPEWEAPLYYFQLRRRVGLGPRRKPPCIVHLHSPSELIFRHNEWDVNFVDYRPQCEFESYTVRAADALICPSRYLAREAELLFDLKPGTVQVIPYPVPDEPPIERGPGVWRSDLISYTGRLELRKGIVEWVDAAVQVASSHPGVVFDFIGSDTSLGGGAGQSVLDYLGSRIPRTLAPRFRFLGSFHRKEDLRLARSKACAAVVPSRWENLPYSCIEAMCTGLPVLVTPTGGMAELVTDGESGWVAADGTVTGLAGALRRLLDTAPEERRRLGRNAEIAVRRICSTETVIRRRLELSQQLVNDSNTTTGVTAPVSAECRAGRSGLGVVVTCCDRPDTIVPCIESIRRQSRQPAALIGTGSFQAKQAAEQLGLEFIEALPEIGRKQATEKFLSTAPGLLGVVFLTDAVRLEPDCLSICESLLNAEPEVGMVSSFVDAGPRGITYWANSTAVEKWNPEELRDVPYMAVRMQALRDLPTERSGWRAVSFPEVLATTVQRPHAARTWKSATKKRYSAMALAQRGSAQLSLSWFMAASWMVKARYISRAFSRPMHTARWLAWQLRSL